MSIFTDIYHSLGLFSSIPANWIDQQELNKPQSYLGAAWQYLKQMTAYWLLFIPLMAVDLIADVFLAAGYMAAFTFAGTDDSRNEYGKKIGFYVDLMTKHALGLLAVTIFFPLVFFPYTFSYWFVNNRPQESGVRAGGGYHHDEEAEVKEPQTLKEIEDIFKDAIASHKKIIPLGAGRSQGKQFLPKSGAPTVVIDMKKFNHVYIDEKAKIATVGAGALWVDIQREANKKNLAVKVMQASNIFSVGGSVATNIHGWDYHTGVLSNAIREMKIINAQGELQILTPEDALFHQITGGLGLFGTVVEVTMDLTDNEYLKRTSVRVAPHDYLNYFNETLWDNPKARLHLYRLSLDPANLLGEGFTETYMALDEHDHHPKLPEHIDFESAHGSRVQRILVNIARRIGLVRKWYWNQERDDFTKNQPLATKNEIMQAPINAVFNSAQSDAEWLQEYFVPGEQLDDFLKKLGAILMENDVTLMNATVRFVKKHDASPLSYAHDGDRFAVVLCFNQSLKPANVIKAKKWLREAQKSAIEHGGSYYLPYQHVSSVEDFEASYPHAQEAKKFKAEIDPQGIFQSGFQEKYFDKPPANEYVKQVLSQEKLRKEFKGFLDKIFQRVNADKIYALLDDILTYTDTQAELYEELCQRLPEIMPPGLVDIAHQLASLSAIKHDLGVQAAELLGENYVSEHGINGIVEIGSPGRYINEYRKHFPGKINGKIVAVNDADESFSDKIDAGSFHPYDEFIRLDYQNLNLDKLETNSADLITCYVGLHHFPPERLDQFLKDVRRILKPNGRFLLVDHDINNEDTKSMAHMAHFIFNAVNGVSLQEELNEHRDFQSFDHWQKILNKHGLGDADEEAHVPLIREEDPTRNRMLVFKKIEPVLEMREKEMIEEMPAAEPEPKLAPKAPANFVEAAFSLVHNLFSPQKNPDQLETNEAASEIKAKQKKNPKNDQDDDINYKRTRVRF